MMEKIKIILGYVGNKGDAMSSTLDTLNERRITTRIKDYYQGIFETNHCTVRMVKLDFHNFFRCKEVGIRADISFDLTVDDQIKINKNHKPTPDGLAFLAFIETVEKWIPEETIDWLSKDAVIAIAVKMIQDHKKYEKLIEPYKNQTGRIKGSVVIIPARNCGKSFFEYTLCEMSKKKINSIYGVPSIPKRSGRYPWVSVERNDSLDAMTYAYKATCLYPDTLLEEIFNSKTKTVPEIKNVIFNEPATIVFWDDGTKSVVKCDDEKFDKEKGLAIAISKKVFGTKESGSNYYDVFKKWIPKESPNEMELIDLGTLVENTLKRMKDDKHD